MMSDCQVSEDHSEVMDDHCTLSSVSDTHCLRYNRKVTKNTDAQQEQLSHTSSHVVHRSTEIIVSY